MARYKSNPLFQVGDITLYGQIENMMRNTIRPEVWSYYLRNKEGKTKWYNENELCHYPEK